MKRLLLTSVPLLAFSFVVLTSPTAGKVTLENAEEASHFVKVLQSVPTSKPLLVSKRAERVRESTQRCWACLTRTAATLDDKFQQGLDWAEKVWPTLNVKMHEMETLVDTYLLWGSGVAQLLGYPHLSKLLEDATTQLDATQEKVQIYVGASLKMAQYIQSYLKTVPSHFQADLKALAQQMLVQSKSLDNDTIIYVDKASNWDIVVRLTKLTDTGQDVAVRFHPASAFVYNADSIQRSTDKALTQTTHILQYFQGHNTVGVSSQDKQIVNLVYTKMMAMGGLLDANPDQGTFRVFFGNHLTNRQHPAVTFQLLPIPVPGVPPTPVGDNASVRAPTPFMLTPSAADRAEGPMDPPAADDAPLSVSSGGSLLPQGPADPLEPPSEFPSSDVLANVSTNPPVAEFPNTGDGSPGPFTAPSTVRDTSV